MGWTDVDQIFSCTKAELEAIQEGLHYKQIGERERLSELALEIRYTMNSKKVRRSVLSKDKDREKIRRAFARVRPKVQRNDSELAARLERVAELFANRK